MKKLALAVLALLVVSLNIHAVPELRLPFTGGEVWSCDQGNYTDPSNVLGNENPTHRQDNIGMDYAWDFNWGDTSNADEGKPVIAPAAGTVVYAKWGDIWKQAQGQWVKDGWGYTVIIDYHDPTDNSHGKVCHLLSNLTVKVGDWVKQGQTIGYCGGTGGYPPHIHYQTQNRGDINGQSIPSRFVEVCENGGVPLEGHSYISANYPSGSNNISVGKFPDGFHPNPNYSPANFTSFSQPFIDCFLGSGGINVLGIPVSEVSQRSSNIYAQEFSNGANEQFTLALNPNVYNSARGYLGVCYPMCGRIRAMWNPNRDGAPVTNEYNVTKGDHPYVVQWFEPTDNNYVCLAYELNMNLFIRDAEKTIGIARDANFNQRLISDQSKNGGGIGGGSPNPTPTYASPPVVTIIDPGTGYREVKTDRANYNQGDTVTVSWLGFESYSPSFRVLSY